MTEKQYYITLAESLKPALIKSYVKPKSMVEIRQDPNAFQNWRTVKINDIDNLKNMAFGRGDSFTVDFGDHYVGYISLSINWVGLPPGAPLRLKLVFGEMPCEIGESFDDYSGWLSRSWLQDEIINIDVLPAEIQLPRRYAFRFLKITVVDASAEYKVVFKDIHLTAVTSADINNVKPLPANVPEDLKLLDKVSIKTLMDCMQTVFEDGPKRDRRLWIGDLRLQALVNYCTFKNYDLVKRCLYLFAGLTEDGGKVPSCMYENPFPLGDHLRLFDYSLFFIDVLHEYLNETNDFDTAKELWPVAYDQIKLSLEQLDERGIVIDSDTWWCFTDWHPELNKQASAQGILIYCMKKGLLLARKLDMNEQAEYIEEKIQLTSQAALTHLWDKETRFFVSGEGKQISWASQIWMILAQVMEKDRNADLMKRLLEYKEAIPPVTPYMHHHIVDVMFLCDMKQEALDLMRSYWGGMIDKGADTFWELYRPDDQYLSPYGSHLINSYCHAWSCTPAYFIRRYLLNLND